MTEVGVDAVQAGCGAVGVAILLKLGWGVTHLAGKALSRPSRCVTDPAVGNGAAVRNTLVGRVNNKVRFATVASFNLRHIVAGGAVVDGAGCGCTAKGVAAEVLSRGK